MSLSNEEVIHLLDDYLHGLLDAENTAEVERRCEISPSCKAALDEVRGRFTALQAAPPPSEAPERLIQATVQRIQRTIDHRRRTTRRIMTGLGAALAASVLILLGLTIATTRLAPTPVNMAVLGQRQLLAATMASLRIRLTDRTAGDKPLANVPVTIELKDATGARSIQLASLSTDALGSAEPRFQAPDWQNGKYTLIIKAKTPKGLEVVTQEVELKRSWQLMLSSDKPIYKPGQIIHVRSLALRRPDLKPVGDEAVTFSVADPKNNVIFKQSGKTSKHGISSTDFELAGDLIEGAYVISCRVGDTESRLQVQVQQYVLPKFEVVLKLDKPFYQPNENAKLTVKANYFFGKPVANGEVEVVVRCPKAGNQSLATLKARHRCPGHGGAGLQGARFPRGPQPRRSRSAPANTSPRNRQGRPAQPGFTRGLARPAPRCVRAE